VQSAKGGRGLTTLLTGGGTRGRETLDDDVDLARDRALVTRAQGGDRSAFDDLYMRYYRRLYRFCLRRLHDSHEAEDVAQEAFARAWRALPTFGGDRRFYPWLSVIASHLCTDVLRRRNRSTPVAEFHQGNVASTEDGGEELMLAAVDSDLVAKAFTRLSDRHQRILHLREGSGWSYQRIADHEGVGITAVETLLWRARQALKREFASLAGADGRMAAWLGGLVSLASLRRLLRIPARASHRMAATGAKGVAVAAGSAVAATAVIVGATLTAPPATTGPSHNDVALPVFPHLAPASVAPAASAAPSTTGSGGDATGSGSGGVVGTPKVPTGNVNAGVGNVQSALQSTAQNAQSALTQTGATVGGIVNNLGTTVQGVTGTIDNVLGTLTGGTLNGGLVTGPLNDITSLLGSTASTVTNLGSNLGNTVGTLGSVTSPASTTGSDTAGAVSSLLSGTVNDVTSTLGGATGGSTGGTSLLGGL